MIVYLNLERAVIPAAGVKEGRGRDPGWRQRLRDRAEESREQRRAGVGRDALRQDEVEGAEMREREVIGLVEGWLLDREDVAPELTVNRVVDQPAVWSTPVYPPGLR